MPHLAQSLGRLQIQPDGHFDVEGGATHARAVLVPPVLSRQQHVDDDPQLLERFLVATLRGIRDARDDPEAATDVVMQFAPNEDRAHQLSMLKVELDSAEGPASSANGVGWATPDQWQAFHDSLRLHGGLTNAVAVEQVFTDKILHAAYRDPRLATR